MNKGRFSKLWSVLFRNFYYAWNPSLNPTFSPMAKMVYQSKAHPVFRRSALAIVPTLLALRFGGSKDDKTKQGETAKIIKTADDLYNSVKYEELHEFLQKEKNSEDPEILWRLARSIYLISKSITKNQEKLDYLEQSLAYLDKALEIKDACWAAHKWRAIVLDAVWRHKSIKGRLLHSLEVKNHMEKAIELNPKDPTTYYILGEWHYTFADLPWYQRKTASILFASPPTSTFEEAFSYFKKAEEVEPGFYSMNWLMLAKCLLKMNQTQDAINYLKKIQNHPILTSDDQEAFDEASKLLKTLT